MVILALSFLRCSKSSVEPVEQKGTTKPKEPAKPTEPTEPTEPKGPRIPLKMLKKVDGADYVSGKWKPEGKKLYHIKVNNETIKEVVYKEVKRLGLKADLYHIDVSGVTNMSGLFMDGGIYEAENLTPEHKRIMRYNYLADFNGDISKWDVSSVTAMSVMFVYSKFNGDISKWDVSNCMDFSYMFYQSNFTGDVSGWDVHPDAVTKCMFE
ncbi:surface protein [Elysia marginata]|uniref:Surface protein n=1 Tax=Elysia marginata TaxID=1093978 RepID=A0AAV4FR79_9GAST|nr:surface protein [Elysia marginata]